MPTEKSNVNNMSRAGFCSLTDDLLCECLLPFCGAGTQRRLAALGRRWHAALGMAGALSVRLDAASGVAALAWLAAADLGRLRELELRFQPDAGKDPDLAAAALALIAPGRCPALRRLAIRAKASCPMYLPLAELLVRIAARPCLFG